MNEDIILLLLLTGFTIESSYRVYKEWSRLKRRNEEKKFQTLQDIIQILEDRVTYLNGFGSNYMELPEATKLQQVLKILKD